MADKIVFSTIYPEERTERLVGELHTSDNIQFFIWNDNLARKLPDDYPVRACNSYKGIPTSIKDIWDIKHSVSYSLYTTNIDGTSWVKI